VPKIAGSTSVQTCLAASYSSPISSLWSGMAVRSANRRETAGVHRAPQILEDRREAFGVGARLAEQVDEAAGFE
jgi:hypothetical protein